MSENRTSAEVDVKALENELALTAQEHQNMRKNLANVLANNQRLVEQVSVLQRRVAELEGHNVELSKKLDETEGLLIDGADDGEKVRNTSRRSSH